MDFVSFDRRPTLGCNSTYCSSNFSADALGAFWGVSRSSFRMRGIGVLSWTPVGPWTPAGPWSPVGPWTPVGPCTIRQFGVVFTFALQGLQWLPPAHQCPEDV